MKSEKKKPYIEGVQIKSAEDLPQLTNCVVKFSC